jgi:hypothetical protein
MATTTTILEVIAFQKGPNCLHIEYVAPDGKRHILAQADIPGTTWTLSFTTQSGQTCSVFARDILWEKPVTVNIKSNGSVVATQTTVAKRLHGTQFTAV